MKGRVFCCSLRGSGTAIACYNSLASARTRRCLAPRSDAGVNIGMAAVDAHSDAPATAE
jgi:hypothetical protein